MRDYDFVGVLPATAAEEWAQARSEDMYDVNSATDAKLPAGLILVGYSPELTGNGADVYLKAAALDAEPDPAPVGYDTVLSGVPWKLLPVGGSSLVFSYRSATGSRDCPIRGYWKSPRTRWRAP